MGAALIIRRFKDMPEAELLKVIAARRDQDAHEDGHLYSGSWGVKHGVRVTRETLDSVEAAETYIGAHSDKHEAILAIRAKSLSKDGKIPAKITNLTVKARAAETQVYEFPQAVIKRVREGKSKTRGCAACGSAIAVAHIRMTKCPVCQKDFLLSETDLKRLKALEGKRDTLRAALKAAEADEKAKLQRRGACPLVWVVGGWCSS